MSVLEFNNTYTELVKVGILYPVINFSKIFDYLFYTNKMHADDNDVENIKVKPKFFDELFYKYGLVNVKLNDLCMCYKYNNANDTPVLLDKLYNNMLFLRDKNVLLDRPTDKCTLEYNIKNNMYMGFELKMEKNKRLYVVYSRGCIYFDYFDYKNI